MPMKQMSDTAENKAGSEKKNNKIVIILIVVLLVIVIALVGVAAFLLGKGEGDKNSTDGINGNVGEVTRGVVNNDSVRMVLDENDSVDLMQQMREEVEEGMFECKMTMEWTFADGKSESPDAYVANSENNTHPIYFDVYMNETEELLYSSPVLPVGTDLKNIRLDKELPAGEYKATVMYNLLKDVASQEVISSAGFIIKIKVQN